VVILMAFTRISYKEYICHSTDEKPTEDMLEGATLWEWDTKTAYIFADGDWREL
jgi:hypothetical protein